MKLKKRIGFYSVWNQILAEKRYAKRQAKNKRGAAGITFRYDRLPVILD